MFRKYYKQANVDIETNRELIDKIFESEKSTKTSSEKSRIYKYGILIAAVFVIAFSLTFYDDITKFNETVVESPVVVEPKKNVSTEKTEDLPAKNAEQKVVVPTEDVQEIVDIQEPDAPVSNAEEPVVASLVVDEGNTRAYDGGEMTADDNHGKHSVSLDEFVEIPAQECEMIAEALIEKFGESDPETGNQFIFEIVGAVETENGKYYLGRWKWFVVDHSSLLTEFVLNEDLSGMFECEKSNGTNVTWDENLNLLTK